MELRTKIIEDSLLVKIIGELDHHTSGEIRQEVDHLFTKNNVKNIIFDLSQMNFMDSSGVGMFMGRYKKIKEKSGMAIMVNIQHANRRLLQMSGLLSIYKEFVNVDDALSAIRGGNNE